MTETQKFNSRLGFILTAAAAAIGLGNIWRFPNLVAEHGGGAFVFIYIVFVVTFGFALMLTETAIGRKTGKTSAEAFLCLCNRYKILGAVAGVLPVIISFLVVSYYTIITGWILKYAVTYISGGSKLLAADNGAFFSTYISTSFEPILWTLIIFVAAGIVLLFGIKKGLEKVCTVLVPLLLICMILLIIYVLTIPGGIDGIAYCFIPDFSEVTISTVTAALGQVFFSLSIGYGIYITYGMYLAKKENIRTAVHSIEIFDTGAAILAMMVVVPIVFAFSGGDPEALGSGSALLFEQIPQAIAGLPNGGIIAGSVFFSVVFLAALTSVFSLVEVPVSVLETKFRMNRKKAIFLVSGAAALISIVVILGSSIWQDFTIFGYNILDFLDLSISNLLLPLAAILCCIVIGWIVGPKTIIEELESSGHVYRYKKFYIFMIKFIVPAFVLAIMVSTTILLFAR